MVMAVVLEAKLLKRGWQMEMLSKKRKSPSNYCMIALHEKERCFVDTPH